ncbi:MAG: [FeFe] hydrogenase H-cluster radical SAM maturase HydE, partial [Bacteroidales bacterium]|nr:[FeFe] hydrogenase H-cluster radical SAM maturase HydE [Bacteroidales bacterium]
KNCYYCGIRAGNPAVNRYKVGETEVLAAIEAAYQAGFGSIVLQSGERQDQDFTDTIERLLKAAVRLSEGRLGITLSLGEQTLETYKRWREAGATRYLLRIETSNPTLYAQLHPADHRFADRVKALEALKAADYQVGSGVMIGLPGQTTADLAADLAFFRDFGIDMVGMGPYIEHHETPLYARRHEIPSLAERYELSLNMLALLRIIMPTVNMAATTAMASLHPRGREEALRIAANVIMPNITPRRYRGDYFLYENKVCICGSEQDAKDNIEAMVRAAGCEIRYFEKGDPRHYFERVAPSVKP